VATANQTSANDTIEDLVGSTDGVLLFDKPSDGSLSPLLSIPDVARLLRVSQSVVRRLQQQRQIPFHKIGGSVRFSERDVAFYLRRRRVEVIG
jgi:excisionase family DNA binding protein